MNVHEYNMKLRKINILLLSLRTFQGCFVNGKNLNKRSIPLAKGRPIKNVKHLGN